MLCPNNSFAIESSEDSEESNEPSAEENDSEISESESVSAVEFVLLDDGAGVDSLGCYGVDSYQWVAPELAGLYQVELAGDLITIEVSED